MVRSPATKAKIAAGMKAYHRSCKGGKKKAVKKPVPARRSVIAGRPVPARRSVFAGRLVDNRSKRGRGPGRKGPASRKNKDGSVDKRFKGRSAKLISAAKKRGRAPLPPKRLSGEFMKVNY